MALVFDGRWGMNLEKKNLVALTAALFVAVAFLGDVLGIADTVAVSARWLTAVYKWSLREPGWTLFMAAVLLLALRRVWNTEPARRHVFVQLCRFWPFTVWHAQTFQVGDFEDGLTIIGVRLVGRNSVFRKLNDCSGYIENYRGERINLLRNIKGEFQSSEFFPDIARGGRIDFKADFLKPDQRRSVGWVLEHWGKFEVVLIANGYKHRRRFNLNRCFDELKTCGWQSLIQNSIDRSELANNPDVAEI